MNRNAKSAIIYNHGRHDKVLNNKIHEYELAAEKLLKIRSVEKRKNSLKNLIGMIEVDNPELNLTNNKEKEYVITYETEKGLIEVPAIGCPDFETYKRTYYDEERRRQKLEECLTKNEPFAELCLQEFVAALRIEYERALLEWKCMSEPEEQKNKKIVPSHFSLANTVTERARLKKVLAQLMEKGYFDRKIPFPDWLYYCTGYGEPPLKKLHWLKDNDELGYFVKVFFNEVPDKYARAAKCFVLQDGRVPNESLFHTNVTKKENKRQALNAIIKLK